MAVIELNALSTALAGSFSATVFCPENADMTGDKSYAALYLIHDIGGNDTDFRTVKNLQKLSTQYGVFVICPSLFHSFGMDLTWGGKYGEFVNTELPGICRHMFPLDENRQYVGGVGSGGYGAYWHGANHPECFSRCVFIEGHLDIAALCEAGARGAKLPNMTAANLQAVFGDLNGVRGSDKDMLCEGAKAPAKLFVGCTEDYPGFEHIAMVAARNKIPHHTGKTEEAVYEAAFKWLVE